MLLRFRSHWSLVIRHSSFWLWALFALTNSAHSQSVRWEPGAGTLARDQVSQLSLIFQDSEPKTTPIPPATDGLEFLGQPGRSEQSSFNLSLGSRAVRQRTVTYIFNVRPTRPDGQVRIPAFTVETDAGALSVPAAGYTLAAATVGQSGLSLDQIANASFTPPAAPIWAGEVFRLSFTLDVDRRYATNSILAGPIDWKPSPLIAEDWSKPAGSETQVNGQARLRVSSETRAIAPSSTTATLLPIPPASQLINLPTGQASPFSLFGQTTFEQFTLTTAPARLAINPLPAPAPADFIGAVGQFTLTTKVVPEKATVGEPITWTLTLEGTGNWPAIDRLRPRSLSRDFRVITPRAQKTPKPESLFDATLAEDLVLIPQKPGRITLPAYTLSVFNPSTGAYETLRTAPVALEITPAPAAVAPAPAASQSQGNTPAPADLDTRSAPSTPAPATPPATLPADPLPTTPLAKAPLAAWPSALLWTLLGLLVPAAVWLALASRHSRLHDPLLPRRQAHDRLREILTELETASTLDSRPSTLNSSATSAALLLAWQHHTATLFGLTSATPSARDLPDPLWAALWAETERALYRASTPLAREWFAQAWQAHAQATPPPRSALAALRPAHLLARAALWLIVLHSACVLGLPSEASAQEGHSSFAAPAAPTPDFSTSYTAGAFPAAESAARDTLASTPLSPGLHHNLALSARPTGQMGRSPRPRRHRRPPIRHHRPRRRSHRPTPRRHHAQSLLSHRPPARRRPRPHPAPVATPRPRRRHPAPARRPHRLPPRPLHPRPPPPFLRPSDFVLRIFRRRPRRLLARSPRPPRGGPPRLRHRLARRLPPCRPHRCRRSKGHRRTARRHPRPHRQAVPRLAPPRPSRWQHRLGARRLPRRPLANPVKRPCGRFAPTLPSTLLLPSR